MRPLKFLDYSVGAGIPAVVLYKLRRRRGYSPAFGSEGAVLDHGGLGGDGYEAFDVSPELGVWLDLLEVVEYEVGFFGLVFDVFGFVVVFLGEALGRHAC